MTNGNDNREGAKSPSRLIWLATPTRDGKAHAQMMASVYALAALAHTKGIKIGLDISQGSPNIPKQRNWSVAKADRAGAEGVLFVDSDIAFDPQEILHIFDRPEPVIGVPHQTRPRQWTDPPNISGRYQLQKPKVPLFNHDEDLLLASRLTTGFLYVKMEAFHRLRDLGMAQQFTANAVDYRCWPYLYTYFMHCTLEVKPGPEMQARLAELGMETEIVRTMDGEDWDFNTRCMKAGIPMYIEPLVSLRHYEGSACMNLDAHTYWTRYNSDFDPDLYINWLQARAERGCPLAQGRLERGPIITQLRAAE